MKKLAIVIVVGLIAWFIQFLISQNRHAVADISGDACPLLTTAEVRDAGIEFYGIGYFGTNRGETIPPDRVNIYSQIDSAGSLDCFVALSDTRCDMTGPAYFRVSNMQKLIYFRLLEGQSAVLQGNADHLTCTIQTVSDADQ